MVNTQNQIYGVVLPVHVAQRARVVAAMNGKSRSNLMRDLLLEYLKRCDELPAQPTSHETTHKDKSKLIETS